MSPDSGRSEGPFAHRNMQPRCPCELGQVGSRFSGEQQCPGELLSIGAKKQKGEEQWKEPWPPACLGREQAEGEGGGCCCGEW